MKSILKTIVLTLLIFIASCSKNEGNSNKELEKEAENKEVVPIDVAIVSDNVIIAGATKEIGAPPTPNEAISLDMSNTSKTALLNEGFEISLDSDADVVGAYVQFKGNDGTLADSYYDIDVIANNINSKNVKSHSTLLKKTGISKVDDEVTIDIDFGSKIKPGTFCYEICVYDGEGNISAPQEICVTVESWGGNSDIVGTWQVKKIILIDDNNDNMIRTLITGEPNCSEDEIYCCETTEIITLVFNADGTYSANNKGTNSVLDEDAFNNNCEIKFKKYNYNYNENGS